MARRSPPVVEPAKILTTDFYSRPALLVARELIGKTLVRHSGGREYRAIITETEAYIGPHDLACHGSRGRTPRTEVMFGPAGHWYVYFIYGMHWMLNVVTDTEGHPAAVLLRGAGTWNGPARLTKALKVDKRQNTLAAVPASGLWIEDAGLEISRRQVRRTPRIGVDYAGHWATKLYRFVYAPSPLPPAEVRAIRSRV